jgi:hypothetical protein
MFRKAALVLAVAVSLLSAQAMDLPEPMRELTNKNKTKPAGGQSGVKSKAKTVDVCFLRTAYDFEFVSPAVNPPPPPNAFLAVVGASVYECADIRTDGTGLVGNPMQIGIAG